MKLYVARDIDNTLHLYDIKPTKMNKYWRGANFIELDESLFSEVNWEDKEPKVLTIEESPWIKVEDGLPTEMTKVVVAFRHKVNDMAICYSTNMIINGKWVNIPMEWDVIAWMPIPEFKE